MNPWIENRTQRISILLPLAAQLCAAHNPELSEVATALQFALRDLERLNDVELPVERNAVTVENLQQILRRV